MNSKAIKEEDNIKTLFKVINILSFIDFVNYFWDFFGRKKVFSNHNKFKIPSCFSLKKPLQNSNFLLSANRSHRISIGSFFESR